MNNDLKLMLEVFVELTLGILVCGFIIYTGIEFIEQLSAHITLNYN
jgi:hypothetical protein